MNARGYLLAAALVGLPALSLPAIIQAHGESEEQESDRASRRVDRLRETNSLLAYLTLQEVGSLPEGVAVPQGSVCSVRGLDPYSDSDIAEGLCTRANYAIVCALATQKHEKECEEYCKAVGKKGKPRVVCKGLSNPTASRFDPTIHCLTIKDKSVVICGVSGDCKCDP